MEKPLQDKPGKFRVVAPRAATAVQQRTRFRKILERILDGRRDQDPLYLSNRSPRKRMLVASAVILPFAAMTAVVLLSSHRQFGHEAVAFSPTETAPKALPEIDHIQLPQSGVGVVNIHFDRGADPHVSGTLRNNTGRTIRSGSVIFDLSNNSGAQVGRFTAELTNLAPGATTGFRTPLKDRSASVALVREIATR